MYPRKLESLALNVILSAAKNLYLHYCSSLQKRSFAIAQDDNGSLQGHSITIRALDARYCFFYQCGYVQL